MALVAVGAAGAVGVVSVNQAQAQGYGGYGCPGMGMMGPGMMGMGPGMMGPMMGQGMMGMGPGMMGGSYGGPQANLNLSADDVKANLERWIAAMGNTRLKPGRVAAVDSDTITADVVTVDREALVQRFSVNRHTGYWQQVQ